MLFLKVDHLEKSYGGRTIFSIESLYLYDQDRIGLVGRNGEGKSTLLSMLAGTAEPDAGVVERYGSVSYVPQLEELDQEISADLNGKWKLADQGQDQISGGEQTRRKIAQALTSNANVLIADEPTSHLDLAGIEQLEHELQAFKGAILLTSHDKDFLNQLCTAIWEIEAGQVTVYEGNYDAYLKQKQIETDKSQREYQEYTREKNRLEQAARQLKAKSDGIKKAPSRMGNSEARLHKRSAGVQKAKLNRAAEAMETRSRKLEKKEKPKEHEPIVFDLAEFPALHSKRIIQFNGSPVKVGSVTLKQHVNGEVSLGSRLAIIGGNGSGKSTLLNQIVNHDPSLTIAQPAKIGFFNQHQENLENNKTILENTMKDSPYNQTFIRKMLARLAFKRDDVHKKADVLSGGERMRASLVKVFLGNYNVLILDEPTNYLDLDTKEALTEVLAAYPGTIIFVTHDRSLVTTLATHTLSFEEAEPTIVTLEHTKSIEDSIQSDSKETELLTIDMQITEVVSRLSMAVKEEEKKELDQQFQELLQKKKRLI